MCVEQTEGRGKQVETTSRDSSVQSQSSKAHRKPGQAKDAADKNFNRFCVGLDNAHIQYLQQRYRKAKAAMKQTHLTRGVVPIHASQIQLELLHSQHVMLVNAKDEIVGKMSKLDGKKTYYRQSVYLKRDFMVFRHMILDVRNVTQTQSLSCQFRSSRKLYAKRKHKLIDPHTHYTERSLYFCSQMGNYYCRSAQGQKSHSLTYGQILYVHISGKAKRMRMRQEGRL